MANSTGPTFSQSLIAGGMAGTSVDILFFPIDTVKTRLQAKEGFWKSGGFSGIYRGIGSVVVGSAPGAAFFFTTYEYLKRSIPRYISPLSAQDKAPIVHMLAASGGEVAACLIRVPTEVIKSRQQTSAYGSATGSFSAFRRVVADQGVAGLYRGFGSTVAREIPFSCIQFPLYEKFKSLAALRLNRKPTSLEAAACGSAAGGIAAAITTPLDVAKTRIMLSARRDQQTGTLVSTLISVYRNEGAGALFSGVTPRVMWISLGGAVFLGVYEAARSALMGNPWV